MPKKTFALLALALVALTSACTAVPGASPTPSVPPTPSPAPTPTPSPSFGPNDIAHPTETTDIVLRLEQGGGFMPINFFITQAPAFTLYGDGTVIFKQLDTRMAGPMGNQAELPWLVGHLDESQIQALLQFALSTGRLANAKATYDNNTCADCGSTTFTLNAAGLSKSVNIYALMEVTDPNQPDAADRQGFNQLATVLNNFQAQSGVDLGEITPYDAALYKVVLLDNGFGQPGVQPKDWPWDDLTPADWPSAEEPDSRVKMLDSAHVAKLLDVPNGGHIGVWVKEPDGTLVQFGVRPLLPDEIDAFNSAS
ncbi:MAG: hypothetical protein ABI725_01835 [Chloroflexota bacterium]